MPVRARREMQRRRTIVLGLGCIAVVAVLVYHSGIRTPALSEAALGDQGVFVLPQPREIAPFSLEQHTGEPFTREHLVGRWTFAFFGFTSCPDVCPTTMAVMGRARQELADRPGEAFQGVLVSVDPDRDDGTTLGHYATAFAPDFIGVRGSRAAIAGLAEQVGATFAMVPALDDHGRPLPDRYQVSHTANIFIINPRGHYHGFIKYPQQADTIVAAFESLATDF